MSCLVDANHRMVDVLTFDESLCGDETSCRFSSLLSSWARNGSEALRLRSAVDSLVFFQLDVQSVSALPTPDIVERCRVSPERSWILSSLETHSTVPVIQLFGCTADGSSVLAHVWGMFGYLYFRLPDDLASHLDSVKEALEDQLRTAQAAKGSTQCVLFVEAVKRKNLLYYSGENALLYCRAVVTSAQLVTPLRTALERGVRVKLSHRTVTLPTLVFEANIPFELRFMADTHMSGCCWVELPSHCYTMRPSDRKVSHCQIEVDVFIKDLQVHPAEGVWQNIPPLRVLSFDIECITESGVGFPVPERDKVIQIATILTAHGGKTLCKTVFTLDSCTSIPGAVVCCFKTEKEMLRRWKELLTATDPDIITGYNCINFDLNYLLVRATTLKLDNFHYLSRLIQSETKIRDTVFSARALGTHENKTINIEGRVQFDMLQVIRRDYKLKSYTLNAVSSHFLKEQKEDVHYSMIGQLFYGNAETRRRVASYCLKDALLPLRLMDTLLVLVNYIEMARVTGTPISFLLTRGQQIKVTSQIIRKCRELGYLFPSIRPQGKGSEEKYEGATVLEPLKGLYKMPVATLDFASLYPSIMMAHNLCYSTLCIEPLSALGLKEEDVIRTPSHSVFVKKSKQKGVLPLIVEDLISARKRAKKEMENATDEFTKMVLNGRQLALKLSANSVYGYTGATAGGQLPCLDVSTAITAYGRDMIDTTKKAVEEHYRREHGYTFDAIVVYGDTDSVMVLFGVPEIAEAMRLGKEAAALVTQQFIPPIKLEFEKVFFPFLLMNKKRYAGVLYTSPTVYTKIDCKGIETVRRDFCLLVQQLVDTVLKKLLLEQDEEGAKEYVRYTVSQLLQNNVDLSLLVVSKSLGKEDYTSKLAHVELAKKLRQRDPGRAPQIGDRVHFVIVPGVKGQPQYDRAEDPLYVLQNNMTIDTQYYLDNIKNPLIRIFEGIMDNPESLFVGEHTHKRKILTSSSSALSRFVKASLRCLSCRSVIQSGALCAFCEKEKQKELVYEKYALLRDDEDQYSKLWTQCQRCQGSLNQDVLCTSRDCPIFYRRMKIKQDIDQIQAQVDRLRLDW